MLPNNIQMRLPNSLYDPHPVLVFNTLFLIMPAKCISIHHAVNLRKFKIVVDYKLQSAKKFDPKTSNLNTN